MTLTSCSAVPGRRGIGVLAAAALTLALLPLSGAAAQDPPEPRDVDLACPEGEVPGAGFPDPSPTFQRYIDCIVAYELAMGRADGTYGPTASITRGQMATFVRNLLEEAGVDLDTGAGVEFTDIAGTTHEGSIRAIANTEPAIVEGFVDNTYRPSDAVRRDQMATFLATAHEVVTGEPWEVADTAFTDSDGNVHEDNIARLAGTGITVGTTATTYAPRRNISRGQMAAFFARHLDILVELGHVEGRFPIFTALAVDPAESANFIGEDHDLTVAAVDQTGAVIDVDATVYYEVYVHDPDTDTWVLDSPGRPEDRTAELEDGEAAFSYSRADVQRDAIVACLAPEEDADDPPEFVEQQEAVCVVTDDDTLEDDRTNLDEGRFATVASKDWVEEDGAVTIQLNWQNELAVATDEQEADAPRYGNVDDLAAFVHPDDGAGEVTVRWNADAGIVGTLGSTLVTSGIPGDGRVAGTDFHIHEGGIDENGQVVVALPAPTLVEGGEVPTEEEPRGLFAYSLDGTVQAAAFVDDLVAALEAADGGFVDYYLNVHTMANPAGEVRGQIADTDESDGGRSGLPPVYKFVDANLTAPVEEVELWFDIAVADAGDLADQAGDFTVTVNDDDVDVADPRIADGAVVLDVVGDPLELGDGDVLSATFGDDAAAEIVGDEDGRDDDATESIRTRSFELFVPDGGTLLLGR